MAGKLKTEYDEVVEMSKKNQLASEAIQKLKLCANEKEKLRKEKETFQGMYVKVNAKHEKLQELVERDSDIHNPNLLTKIIFNQWKQCRANNETRLKKITELLNKTTDHYTTEKATNIKLILENDEIKETNKQLENEILKLKKEHSENIKTLDEKMKMEEKCLNKGGNSTPSVVCLGQIKDEPIEIDD